MSDHLETVVNEEPAVVPAPTEVTIQDVAEVRTETASIKAAIADLEAAIAQSEYGQRLAELKAIAKEVFAKQDALEAAYKAQCVEAYATTGEKQQPGGVVKMHTVLHYDPGLAVDWSIKHGHANLLKLDVKAFDEEVAKAEKLRPDFVELVQEPRMSLAKDLSEHLEGE